MCVREVTNRLTVVATSGDIDILIYFRYVFIEVIVVHKGSVRYLAESSKIYSHVVDCGNKVFNTVTKEID